MESELESSKYFCVTGQGIMTSQPDWSELTFEDRDVATVLLRCLAAAQKGVRRMDWQQVTLSVYGLHGHHGDRKQDIRPRLLPAIPTDSTQHKGEHILLSTGKLIPQLTAVLKGT